MGIEYPPGLNQYTPVPVAVGITIPKNNKENGVSVINGNIGIEYLFNFPLQLSMDLKLEVN